MNKLYDKIVRDNIPDIIEDKGRTCKYHTVNNAEAIEYLIKKIHEEADELAEEVGIEELADLQEIIDSIANKIGYSKMDLIDASRRKTTVRGSFHKNIILESVD